MNFVLVLKSFPVTLKFFFFHIKRFSSNKYFSLTRENKSDTNKNSGATGGNNNSNSGSQTTNNNNSNSTIISNNTNTSISKSSMETKIKIDRQVTKALISFYEIPNLGDKILTTFFEFNFSQQKVFTGIHVL